MGLKGLTPELPLMQCVPVYRAGSGREYIVAFESDIVNHVHLVGVRLPQPTTNLRVNLQHPMGFAYGLQLLAKKLRVEPERDPLTGKMPNWTAWAILKRLREDHRVLRGEFNSNDIYDLARALRDVYGS